MVEIKTSINKIKLIGTLVDFLGNYDFRYLFLRYLYNTNLKKKVMWQFI